MNELHHSVSIPFLMETIAFLLTVVILVPSLKRMGVSPILGYLAVGSLIGPHALAWVSDAEEVQHFAELGVVFLLFTIGLELSFDRLKSFTRLIFGLGLLQVVVTAGVIACMATVWGNGWRASIIIGLCLALSSTAMVMQLLSERGELGTPHGRTGFAILLFQDLAVVPILILVSLLGSSAATSTGDTSSLSWLVSLIQALVAVGLIIAFGRYGLSPVYRVVARTGNTDVFTALTLLTILATALITGLVGLSLALGAFLAGLILAETEFRYQIESEIEPFKGLLLGLFFMGVGMNISFAVAFERGLWVLLSVVGLLAIKTLVTFSFALVFKLKPSDALQTALLLAQGGEFAFVVIGQATLSYQLIDFPTGQFMVVVAGISMALTPLLAYAGRRVEQLINKSEENRELDEQYTDHLDKHIIIAGYGRMGKTVAQLFAKNRLPYIGLEQDPDIVKKEYHEGSPVFLGDVTRADLLKKAGADKAQALVVTLDNPKASVKTVQIARRHWPHLHIVARAPDAQHGVELSQSGASSVVLETLEASLEIANRALMSLGLNQQESHQCIEAARKEHLFNLSDSG